MIRRKADVNVSSVTIAFALGAQNRIDEALPWLERAIDERDTLVPFLNVYRSSRPRWPAIRDSARCSAG